MTLPPLIQAEIISFKAKAEGGVDGVLVVVQAKKNIGDGIDDDDALIVFADKGASELFGFPKEELEQKTLNRIVPYSARSFHAKYSNRFFDQPPGTNQGMRDFRVVTGLRKNGTEYQLSIGLSRIDVNEEKYAIAYLKDEAPAMPAFVPPLMAGLKSQTKQEVRGLKTVMIVGISVLGTVSLILLLLVIGFIRYWVEQDNPPPSRTETIR